MAKVLGVVADVLGVYSFVSGLFGSQAQNAAVVRVAACINGNGLSGADGRIDSIRNYNINQALIGNSGGDYVGSGNFKDFYVSQPNSQQAFYTQISASNDAICMPYATITWVDGKKYGWTGDFGYECGLSWYPGNIVVSC
jgi:hypothetical protein